MKWFIKLIDLIFEGGASKKFFHQLQNQEEKKQKEILPDRPWY